MQDLREELLWPPSPLVALVGDASSAAFIDVLAVILKTSGAPGAGGSGASPPPVSMRYEAAAPPGAFSAKGRAHADAEYATYVPAGVMGRGWMERHHNKIPAAIYE